MWASLLPQGLCPYSLPQLHAPLPPLPQVTGAALLTFRPRELELVAQGLLALRPLPTPPLPWVRAFSDARDALSDDSALTSALRNQLLMALRAVRRAWQARVAEEGLPGAGEGPRLVGPKGSGARGWG